MRKLFSKISKFITIIALITFSFFPAEIALAANTHSADFELSSSQYATVASDLGIACNNVTLEAWFKMETVADQTIIYQGDDTTFCHYMLFTNTSGSLIFGRRRPLVANTDITYAGSLTTGVWYHAAGTYDGTNMRLYIATAGGSHSLVAGPTASSGNGDASQPNWSGLGARNDNAGLYSYFDGLVDEGRVWSVARTAAELDDNFETELTGSESNLRAYWKLNNGWLDETSNNYDLTAVNTPVFSTDVPFTGATPAAGVPVKAPDLPGFLFLQ